MGVEALKVVHVCAPAAFGGLERVIQGLSCGLVRHGHDVSVISVMEPGASSGPFLDPLRRAGVTVEVIEVPRRAYLREIRSVGGVLDAIGPDVLHTHGHRPDLLHPGHARRRRIATVTTLHGFGNAGGNSSLSERLQTRTLGRFDGVVAVSAPIASSLPDYGVSPRRVHLVPNGWEPPADAKPQDEARRMLDLPFHVPVIGWVGRLCEVKGPDVFVDALSALHRRSQGDWMACIVGDGPDRTDLEERVRKAGLTGRVRFAGMVPDASGLLSAFDMLVSSSRSEGTPMVLLEAMGAGVPVVAASVGGIPALLDAKGPDALGWLVPPLSPGGMASTMSAVLGNHDERKRRAAVARARVKSEYGVDRWVRRYEDVYRQVIAN